MPTTQPARIFIVAPRAAALDRVFAELAAATARDKPEMASSWPSPRSSRQLTRTAAIGDCHGQELNRRNLHDPALSPAQVEPRPRSRGCAPANEGLDDGIPDWKSVSLVRRARKYPRAPHAGLPRRRSHASRHRPHANGISLPAHVGPGKRRTMRAAPIKRNTRSHAVGEDRSSSSRIGLDLVWNNPS
jgi:hypothetical protein